MSMRWADWKARTKTALLRAIDQAVADFVLTEDSERAIRAVLEDPELVLVAMKKDCGTCQYSEPWHDGTKLSGWCRDLGRPCSDHAPNYECWSNAARQGG